MSCFDCPAEIGRIIFELAAIDSPHTAYNLRSWIEPLLYRRLTLIEEITTHRFTVCRFSRNNNQFFVRTVRELRMSTPGFYNDYIWTNGVFTNVTHLYLRLKLHPPEGMSFAIEAMDHIPNLRCLPCLTHLIVDGYDMTLTAEMHPNVTHLQICSFDEFSCPGSLSTEWSNSYPSLIHLMWKLDIPVDRTEGKVEEPIAHLRENLSLRCIVVVISGLDLWSEATWAALRDLDPRLVLVNCGDHAQETMLWRPTTFSLEVLTFGQSWRLLPKWRYQVESLRNA